MPNTVTVRSVAGGDLEYRNARIHADDDGELRIWPINEEDACELGALAVFSPGTWQWAERVEEEV